MEELCGARHDWAHAWSWSQVFFNVPFLISLGADPGGPSTAGNGSLLGTLMRGEEITRRGRVIHSNPAFLKLSNYNWHKISVYRNKPVNAEVIDVRFLHVSLSWRGSPVSELVSGFLRTSVWEAFIIWDATLKGSTCTFWVLKFTVSHQCTKINVHEVIFPEWQQVHIGYMLRCNVANTFTSVKSRLLI